MNLIKFIFKGILLLVLVLASAEPVILGITPIKIVIHAALIIYLLVTFSQFFTKYIVQRNSLNEWIKRSSLIAFSLIVVLLVIELIFTFIPRSHGWDTSHSARNWFQYYWTNNDVGFRDEDLEEKDLAKPALFFVGDSFTAGHGIKNPANRYSDILSKRLDGHEVYNLGMRGADSRIEYELMMDYPTKPDFIVLQYYGNDIVELSKKQGKTLPQYSAYDSLSSIEELLIRGTYLGNYLYWKFPQTDRSEFNDFLITSYKDSTLMAQHKSDLQKFIDYSTDRKVPLVVVLFPYLFDLKSSEVYIGPLVDFFSRQQVPVLNVSEIVVDLPLEKRMVNANDAHPSEMVHQLVAEMLWNEVFKGNTIEK